MTKWKQIFADDLANLASRLEELKLQEYQTTQEATQRIQAIKAEIQAIQSRQQLLNETLAPKGK